jgi:hypothetical protein
VDHHLGDALRRVAGVVVVGVVDTQDVEQLFELLRGCGDEQGLIEGRRQARNGLVAQPRLQRWFRYPVAAATAACGSGAAPARFASAGLTSRVTTFFMRGASTQRNRSKP